MSAQPKLLSPPPTERSSVEPWMDNTLISEFLGSMPTLNFEDEMQSALGFRSQGYWSVGSHYLFQSNGSKGINLTWGWSRWMRAFSKISNVPSSDSSWSMLASTTWLNAWIERQEAINKVTVELPNQLGLWDSFYKHSLVLVVESTILNALCGG